MQQGAAEEDSRPAAITQLLRPALRHESRASKKIMVRRAASLDSSEFDEEVTPMQSQSPTMSALDDIYMQVDQAETTPMPDEDPIFSNTTVVTTPGPMPKGIIVRESGKSTVNHKDNVRTHNESDSWHNEQFNASNKTHVDNWHSRQKVEGH